jgi:hypothetical protein
MWGHGYNDARAFKYFDETKDIDVNVPNETGKDEDYFFNRFSWVREKYNFPNRIAEHYGVTLDNESIFGGSLQRVVRKTYSWIFNNTEKAKDTLFILEWPIGCRGEYFSNYHNRCINYNSSLHNFDNVDSSEWDFFANKFLPKYLNPDLQGLLDLQSLIGLCSFLDSQKYEYIILLDEYPLGIWWEKIKKYIDSSEIATTMFDKIIKPKLVTFYSEKEKKETYGLVTYYFHYELADYTHDTNSEIADGHPSIRGGKLIAEQIINHINKKYEK